MPVVCSSAALGLVLLQGCHLPPPATAPAGLPAGTPAAAPVDDPAVKEMAALAFIAYLGEKVTGSDEEVERQLAPCLEAELAKQPLTQGRWTLAWGPAVYRFGPGTRRPWQRSPGSTSR